MQASQPVMLNATGWRRGLRSLWRKELGEWWQTKRWLVHALIWVLVIDGILAMISIALPLDPSENTPLPQAQIDLLINLGSAAGAIGVVQVVLCGALAVWVVRTLSRRQAAHQGVAA